MPGNACLGPYEAAAPDLCRSCDARLRDKTGIPLYLDVVPYLDKIVYLRHGADVRAPDARAVDRGVGAYFDAVADLDYAELRNLLYVDGPVLPAAVVEPVAVAAEPHPAVKNAFAPYDDPLAQRDLRIDVRLCADLAVLADENLRFDHGAVAYDGVFLDHRPGPDIDALSETRRRIYHRGRMHRRLSLRFGRGEDRRRRHARMVGVVDPYDRTGRKFMRPIARKKHGRSLRRGDGFHMLRIFAETQIAGARRVEARSRDELDILPFESSADAPAKLARFHLISSLSASSGPACRRLFSWRPCRLPPKRLRPKASRPWKDRRPSP